jgi:hypothetical protein
VVNNNGFISAKAAGTTRITVTTEDRNFTASCEVKCLQITPPALTTLAATNITATSATLGGNITNVGVPAYTERGICYSRTVSVPEIGLSGCYAVTVSGSGTGNFTRTLTSLDENTTYYVRAYVKTDAGVTYGNAINFKTPIDSSTKAQVRFKKDIIDPDVTRMGLGDGWTIYYHQFGSNPSQYYYYDAGWWDLYYYDAYYNKWYEEGEYNFKVGRKYTVTLVNNYYITVTDDGPFKSSDSGIPHKPATTVIKVK